MTIRAISSVDDASKYDDGNTVLVLKDTFANVRCQGDFLKALMPAEVSYQRNCQGVVTRWRAPLTQVQNTLLPYSQHEDSILLMDENILAAEGLMKDAPSYLQDDCFRYFPDMLRPSPLCLILGGTGSRSDLHADPLAWTGWNCLLDGLKAWRFYCHEPPAGSVFQGTMRPFGIKSMEAELCSIGTSWMSLVDTFATGDTSDPFSLKADLSRFPHASSATRPLEYLQKPGETLIFPGHWWHQTYHLGPTLGFAGQVLNHQNLQRVMGHVIDWCGLKVDENLWTKTPQEIIAQVLGDAIDSM
eukprot:Skav235611  [mRNA]  locus=scaffold358:14187:15089:+ [translate_table: standard]